MRLWTLDGEVLIASIKTKMHAISPDVAEGLQRASSWPSGSTRRW